MKIKSIHIENFRQYKNFALEFDTSDKEKNITVIRAANSTGKTTFMQAIKWCLFGESAIELDKQSDLINYNELRECRIADIKDTYYRVVMEIIENGSTVKINRTQNLNITANTVKKMNSIVAIEFQDDKGETRVIRNENREKEQIIQRKINSLLSIQMVNYFLFDGERIEKLSSKGTVAKREVSEAITAVSTLPILNNSIETLTRLSNDVRKLKAKSSNNEEYRKLEINISLIEDKLEELESKIEEKKIKEEEAEKQINIINKELSEIDDISQFQDKKMRLKNEIKRSEEINENRYNSIQALYLEYSTLKYIYLLDRKYKKINLSEEAEDNSIPNMEVTAIDKIIENGVCICGTHLQEEHIQTLMKQRNYQPPISNEAMIKDYSLSLTKEVAKIDNIVKQLKEKIKEYNDLFSSIAQNKEELKILEEKISKMPQQRIKELNEQSNSLERELTYNTVKREEYTKKLNLSKEELEKYKFKIVELEEKIKFNEILEVQEEILKKSLDQLRYRKVLDEKKLRQDVENFANKHFKDIITKDKNISIDEKFNLKVTEPDGTESAISSGESVAVSISIILSIIDTFKSNLNKNKKEDIDLMTKKDFFVVMDGPFAMLDQYFSKNISQKISESIEQVILLTNDNQYSESIKNAFRPKTSKEYLLDIPPENRRDSILTEDLKEVIL
ncbi:AAA family ATPase [Macrococcus sp. EM39E]|uniref:AAA family ATPase n=1 Tax=Macrococcus animalis TaxID=3395467 RepID=UPI0039BE9FEE